MYFERDVCLWNPPVLYNEENALDATMINKWKEHLQQTEHGRDLWQGRFASRETRGKIQQTHWNLMSGSGSPWHALTTFHGFLSMQIDQVDVFSFLNFGPKATVSLCSGWSETKSFQTEHTRAESTPAVQDKKEKKSLLGDRAPSVWDTYAHIGYNLYVFLGNISALGLYPISSIDYNWVVGLSSPKLRMRTKDKVEWFHTYFSMLLSAKAMNVLATRRLPPKTRAVCFGPVSFSHGHSAIATIEFPPGGGG